jgi:hypothetical protein
MKNVLGIQLMDALEQIQAQIGKVEDEYVTTYSELYCTCATGPTNCNGNHPVH